MLEGNINTFDIRLPQVIELFRNKIGGNDDDDGSGSTEQANKYLHNLLEEVRN